MLRKLGVLLSLVVLFAFAAFAAVAPGAASPGACNMLNANPNGLVGMDGSQGGKKMVPLVVASLGIGCTP